jgi:putative hydrolase of the HAD superfamily
LPARFIQMRSADAVRSVAPVYAAGRAAKIDLVTVDAFGTMVELVEPYDRLRAALAARGVQRDREAVAAAFSVEAAYYLPRSHEGRDAASLATLRRDCAGVFLAELEADVDPGEFAPAYVEALEFHPVHGAVAALTHLRSAGFVLACVANWDMSLGAHLATLGLSHLFAAVVTSAEAGAPKPDPRPFRLAIERVGIASARALHIGDSETDREGARATGLAFEPVPLATLPARLGL